MTETPRRSTDCSLYKALISDPAEQTLARAIQTVVPVGSGSCRSLAT